MLRRIIYDIETFAPNEQDVTSCVNGVNKYSPFPLKEKITIISLHNLDTDEKKSFYGDDEKAILEKFWECIQDDDVLIGFNSISFDDKYLVTRSFVNSVKIKRFTSQDVRMVFAKEDMWLKGKLSDYAEAIGFKPETKNGSLMREFYLSGNWEGIKAHCEEDVMITSMIYKKCQECGILP